MKTLRLFLGTLTLLNLISTAVVAQSKLELLYRKNGSQPNMGMGVATAGNYDVNGDGWKDFIIGAPGASAAGTESVFVYSGSTGNLIFSVGNLPGSNSDFGRSVALVGDIAYGGLQLDGKSEFIVGIPFWGTSGNQNRGAVNIYSGADGSFLYQILGESQSYCQALPREQLGASVAAVGDVNGDGSGDFIVGSPLYTVALGCFAFLLEGGRAAVYSGATGGTIFSWTGVNNYDHFGAAVNSAGDINGDGKVDFIIGAPQYGASDKGRVYIYSGANGQLLDTLDGFSDGDKFGFSVASAGNIYGGSGAEYIIGAPYTGSSDVGSAYIFSGLGTSRTLLYQKDGSGAGDQLGYSVAGAGRVNFDGTPDFVIGAPGRNSGRGTVYLYSGGDGSFLDTVSGSANDDRLGTSVAGGGDMVSPSSYEEFILGAPFTDTTGVPDRGTAYVYRYDPTPPSVTVISPNGEVGGSGEYVSKCPCPPFTITWNATDNVGVTSIEIRLDRFNDGVFEQQIAMLSGNPGSYNWCPTGSNSNNAKIKVIATDGAGNSASDVSDNTFRIGQFCFEKPAVILPTFNLEQNYPNPFNANTNISFSLDVPSKVELVVYNILGEKVRTLVSKDRAAGAYEVAFDGRDDKGKSLSSGTYFYKLTAGDRVITKQMALIK